jgi:hypothetical protein
MNEGAEDMNTHRKTAIVVGILFIIATAFLFIGEAFYGPILDSADYLVEAYPERGTITLGILLEFSCIIAIPLIAVFMFPVLRKYNEALAIGYVGFRFFEAVLFFGVDLKKLSLIDVSKGYLADGGSGATFFENLGSSIQAENTWAFSIYVLVFAIGALIFYWALYESKLVPRFLSIWGIIAAVMILMGTVMSMVEVGTGISDEVFQLVVAAPIAVNEMVLAIWLIAKGFSPAAVDVGPVGQPRLAGEAT